MQIYKVGGAVRDRLLGLESNDTDWVVVGATPEMMRAQGFRQVGADFPVFLHPATGQEYALARTERKRGRGYHGFAVDCSGQVTLEEDLGRRDLTINAMAEDAQGRLIDPYGGAQDLERKVLRHVSPAFAEDPLRVLRLARFAARYPDFSIAPQTLALMQAMAAGGELAHLTPERVWKEIDKALGEAAPERFIEVLRECGALTVILPEVDALFGIPQPPQHHPEVDTGIHTLLVIQQAARLTPDRVTRFAALTHDLGKALTPPEILPRHHGHEEAGVAVIEALCQRLRVPTEYREVACLVSRYHLQAHKAFEVRPGTLLKLLTELGAFRQQPMTGPSALERFVMACEADARGSTGLEYRDYPQAGYILQAGEAASQVSGGQFLEKGYPPGPAIGQMVTQARVSKIKALRRAFEAAGVALE